MPEQHFSDETTVAPSVLGIWRFWLLRLVVFFVVLLAAYIGCQMMVHFFPKTLSAIPVEFSVIAFALFGSAVMITLYRLLVRWSEKRDTPELAARTSLPYFAGGTVLGFGLFCCVIAVEAAYGSASIKGFAGYAGVAPQLAMALLAGVAEEIIMRGVVFRLIEDGLGTLIAIVLSGALFGLMHGLNPGATVTSSTAIAVEAGMLLAAAYILTRSLWLPIGLHFGWNFTEGGIFSAAVSGGKAHGMIATTFAGPDWLTGGAFGPEASLPAAIICTGAALLLLVLAIRRGEWKPLRFRFASA